MFFEMNNRGGGTTIDVSNPNYHSTGATTIAAFTGYTVNCGCRAKYVVASCRSSNTTVSGQAVIFCDVENEKDIAMWGVNEPITQSNIISNVTDTSFVFTNPLGSSLGFKFLVYA